jgi:hypothetical protein
MEGNAAISQLWRERVRTPQGGDLAGIAQFRKRHGQRRDSPLRSTDAEALGDHQDPPPIAAPRATEGS